MHCLIVSLSNTSLPCKQKGFASLKSKFWTAMASGPLTLGLNLWSAQRYTTTLPKSMSTIRINTILAIKVCEQLCANKLSTDVHKYSGLHPLSSRIPACTDAARTCSSPLSFTQAVHVSSIQGQLSMQTCHSSCPLHNIQPLQRSGHHQPKLGQEHNHDLLARSA
jgi:hypothetical protein